MCTIFRLPQPKNQSINSGKYGGRGENVFAFNYPFGFPPSTQHIESYILFLTLFPNEHFILLSILIGEFGVLPGLHLTFLYLLLPYRLVSSLHISFSLSFLLRRSETKELYLLYKELSNLILPIYLA